jgi:ABC-type transport system involved in multi-copper enzyme maturation permease subunit
MTAFLAMLMDAYRQLNSKKMFWVVLSLSGIVVLFYGSIGFDETGMSMFFGLSHVDNPMLTHDSDLSKVLYRSIFSTFILGLWLAWIATILALVSTTAIFPDFLADGAIDIVLSKPVTRIKVFFFKYIASLLFVVLQVTIFCVGVFFCLGVRLGDWEWRIFAAIPLLTVFFSYLYSVNVLVGVWTRSTLAALLVTMLFWFSIFSTNAAETIVNRIKTQMVMQVEESDREIARMEERLTALDSSEVPTDSPAAANLRRNLDSTRTERDERLLLIDKIDRWHQPVRILQAIMPKTGETIGLLDRWLRRDTDINIMDILEGAVVMDESGRFRRTQGDEDREIERRLETEAESRSDLYILGTSVAFEAVVLLLACTVFVRRDY